MSYDVAMATFKVMKTVNDVAQELGLHRTRIHQIRDELDVGTYIGRQWFFSRADVKKMKNRNTKVGRPKES